MTTKLKRPLFLVNQETDNVLKRSRHEDDHLSSPLDDRRSQHQPLNEEFKRQQNNMEDQFPTNYLQSRDERLIRDELERQKLEATVFGQQFLRNETDDDSSDEERIDNDGMESMLKTIQEENDRTKELKQENDLDVKSATVLDKSSNDHSFDQRSTTSDEEKDHENVVWKDSDDEDTEIDLNAHMKTKKLRQMGRKLSSEKSVVSAKEYQRRLRIFHNRSTVADTWLESMKKKESEKYDERSDSSDEEDQDVLEELGKNRVQLGDEKTSTTKDHKITTKLSKFASSSIPIFSSNHTSQLASTKLLYKCLSDANRREPSNCPLKCFGFIPKTDLLYTAGRDKTIRVFKIDGKNNYKINSVHLKDSPIKFATCFTSTSSNHNPSIYFITTGKAFGQLDVETSKVSMWDVFGSKSVYKLHQIATRQYSPNPNQGNFEGNMAVSSDNGNVHLLDTKSGSLVRTYKMNAQGTALTFNPRNENQLFTGDAEGMVYTWDLGSSKCVNRFHDEGSTGVTSMATSNQTGGYSSSYLSVGSRSGYVNIYNIDGLDTASEKNSCRSTSFFDDVKEETSRNIEQTELHFEVDLLGNSVEIIPDTTPVVKEISEYRQPLKALNNLTTPVTSLAFHPKDTLLAISTKWTKEGIKIAQIPSFNVYSNFPNQNGALNLKYPTSVAFNDDGSFMGIGNDNGHVKLFQLK